MQQLQCVSTCCSNTVRSACPLAQHMRIPASMKSLILLAAYLVLAARAHPGDWVEIHAKGNCSENLPLGGHFPDSTHGHGSAGPVALDPSIAFSIRNDSGPVTGAVCQDKPVLVQATWGQPGELRAYLLTASDDDVSFTSSSAVPGSRGSSGDPNQCTNRVYTDDQDPHTPLTAVNASTMMTIPCGTSGPVMLIITTAKGQYNQHLQATYSLTSQSCGCATATGALNRKNPATPVPAGSASSPSITSTSTASPTTPTSSTPSPAPLGDDIVPSSSSSMSPPPDSATSSSSRLTTTPASPTDSNSPSPAAASSQQVPILFGMVLTMLAAAAI